MLSIDMDSFWKYKYAKNFPYWDFFDTVHRKWQGQGQATILADVHGCGSLVSQIRKRV